MLIVNFEKWTFANETQLLLLPQLHLLQSQRGVNPAAIADSRISQQMDDSSEPEKVVHAYLLNPSKQVFKDARCHPTLMAGSVSKIINVSEHCMRLATPCLAVSKHTTIIPSHAILHHWSTRNSEQVLLQQKYAITSVLSQLRLRFPSSQFIQFIHKTANMIIYWKNHSVGQIYIKPEPGKNIASAGKEYTEAEWNQFPLNSVDGSSWFFYKNFMDLRTCEMDSPATWSKVKRVSGWPSQVIVWGPSCLTHLVKPCADDSEVLTGRVRTRTCG